MFAARRMQNILGIPSWLAQWSNLWTCQKTSGKSLSRFVFVFWSRLSSASGSGASADYGPLWKTNSWSISQTCLRAISATYLMTPCVCPCWRRLAIFAEVRTTYEKYKRKRFKERSEHICRSTPSNCSTIIKVGRMPRCYLNTLCVIMLVRPLVRHL
jgi:hypothetical protein